MRRLGDSPAATVVGVAAVQEELGIRGAGPAAARVKPDVGIAIDVTLCGDTPGLEYSRLPISMGKGPAIKYFDWAPEAGYGSAVPRHLTDRLERAAEAAGVEYQREVLLGGATDAWGIANSGFLSGCISVPSRYIHSAVGLRPPRRRGGRRPAAPRLHRRRGQERQCVLKNWGLTPIFPRWLTAEARS